MEGVRGCLGMLVSVGRMVVLQFEGRRVAVLGFVGMMAGQEVD